MSWNYLPELAEAFSRSSFSDITRLEQLRSSRIAALFYFRDKEISACRSSRSGMTSPLSGQTTRTAPGTSTGCARSGTSSVFQAASLARNISSCGKGAGIAGKKSGLWHEMARVVAEIRPAFVFAENSPMLAGRGLGVVLGTLAALGYDAKWCVLGADDLGYPIVRKRIWILGMRHGVHGQRPDARSQQSGSAAEHLWCPDPLPALQDAQDARLVSDGLAVRDADGLAGALEPVRAIGNGQVPAVAALAWRLLTGSLMPAHAAAGNIHIQAAA